ncbi:MAG: GntR family transcriptional regulator [Hyphomonadaceae bacterium]|jgi:DNA-binding GntR family transcriptional regulator|nr:GntR family transcriptional regulator [Hyphomonadaceae bacterium]
MKKSTARNGDRAGIIYRALRRAIIEQALEPGAKLPEDAIGDRFGVSRTLVRHALGRLAGEGLVELRRNHGAAVAKPSWDEARDISAVRLGLESLVVSILAGQLSADQVARLRRHVKEEEAVHGTNEPVSIRLAGEFHIVLADMTGNGLLARYVGEVTSRFGLILALYGRPHSSECAVSEHRAIIDALEDGNAQRATALMQEHLNAVAGRALIQMRPERRQELRDILAAYAEGAASHARVRRKR